MIREKIKKAEYHVAGKKHSKICDSDLQIEDVHQENPSRQKKINAVVFAEKISDEQKLLMKLRGCVIKIK